MRKPGIFLFGFLVAVGVAVAPWSRGLADGAVSLVFAETAGPVFARVRYTLADSRMFEVAQDHLARTFRMPRPLTIRIGAEDGPLYDSDLSEIWMPYEFFLSMEDTFAAVGAPQGEARALALDVVEHTLYHEIGHALVDMFDLPVTGREEDAVDALATVMVIDLFEDGGDVAISAADAFFLQAEELPQDETAFWGEHSLDEQRFYAILCLTFGSGPDLHGPQMPAEIIEQADRCLEEWETQRRSWLRLLEPHRN